MRLKSAAVSIEKNMNLGNYNGVKIGCSLWATFEVGDDENVAMWELWNMANANVDAQLLPYKKGAPHPTVKVEETFLGRKKVNIKTETGDDLPRGVYNSDDDDDDYMPPSFQLSE